MMDERDDATDSELGVAERVGRALLRDPAHPAWNDARFLEWLAADAREDARRAWRLSRAERRAHGETMMARAHARRLRVMQGGAAPLVKSGEPGVGNRIVPVVELGIAAGVGRELWDEPTDTWIEVPNDAPQGEYVALRVVGDSMAPLMHTGDTVLVRVGSDVRRDTVIVARHPDDGYVCKRVSRIRRSAIELSSLERGRPRIVIPRDPSCIVGTVILVWCHHRQ